MDRAVVLLLLLAGTGCATAPATQRPLPRERAAECVAHCDALGMRLSAVVIIMSHAGCVCEPTQPRGASTAASPAAGTAAVAGGAAIVLATQQAQQQQQSPAGVPHAPGRSWSPVGPHR